ncbi:MAG: hypothetical protein ACOZNI_32280 [Myxococcota bacterium]
MLLSAMVSAAVAAGFHFLKAEGIYGVGEGGVPEAGAGVSLMSDSFGAWATFGSPGADGGVLRAWRLEGQPLGPVIGYVPPAFRGMVAQAANPRAIPWMPVRIGGDAAARKDLEIDVGTHWLVNAPGFWEIDPRHAYLGPSVGIGANATWWDGWRGGDAPVMTGKLKAEAGFGGGLTLRDTWYAQGRARAWVDLFGGHQGGVSGAAATGVYLHRVGLPLGLELRGEIERGDDNVLAAPDTSWSLRAAVFWRLAPEYQTRIEEDIERAMREQSTTASR